MGGCVCVIVVYVHSCDVCASTHMSFLCITCTYVHTYVHIYIHMSPLNPPQMGSPVLLCRLWRKRGGGDLQQPRICLWWHSDQRFPTVSGPAGIAHGYRLPSPSNGTLTAW